MLNAENVGLESLYSS